MTTISKKGRKEGKRKSQLNRREFIKKSTGFIVASSAVTSGIVKPEKIFAALSSQREINIGTFGPSHCATPFVYTKLQGFFKDENLNVNLINYPTMPQIAKDLMSGRLDFGQLIVPLVFAQIAGTNGAALMVRKRSGITGPEDFKGKTMANHSKLSVHYLINMMFLETYGLNYQRDVNFKVINLNKIVDTMKNGEIDTFVMPEPKDAVTEAKGIGDIYLLSKHIWPNHPCCSVVTRREFFDKNKSLVTDVTRMITKSGLLVNRPESREDTIDILQSTSEYNYDKVPHAALKKAFTPGRSDFFPFPYQSTAMLLADIMKKYNLIPSDTDGRQLAREVFQSDLSRKLMAELGTDPPESDFRIEKILGKLKDYTV